MRPLPEPALPYDGDPRAYAKVLLAIHEARQQGDKVIARPRLLVDESWARMSQGGPSPWHSDPQVDHDALSDDLEQSSALHGAPAEEVIHFAHDVLSPGLVDSDLVGVVATSRGRVADRFGSHKGLRRADRIGFVPAAAWNEKQVGTNAIGTSLVMRRPVQIHGPEHWCCNQHDWSCAAAPVFDPASGRLLMVLDVSGDVAQAHPALLGMVHAVAGQVELHLAEEHRQRQDRLRARTWATVSHLSGPWVLTDEWGWVVGSNEVLVGDRIRLQPGLPPEELVVPELGMAELTHLDDAILLIPRSSSGVEVRYQLDASAHTLTVTVGSAPTVYRLTGRHVAILTALLEADRPLCVADLSAQVWGSAASSVTARAEVSRLRRRFPGLVSAAPYRLLSELHLVPPAER